MPNNRISRKEWKKRRKRQLIHRFVMCSFMVVAVFLLVLIYVVAQGTGGPDGIPENTTPQEAPAQAEAESAAKTTEAVPTETIYIDTTAPKGTAKELVICWNGKNLKPEDFVESMSDDTEITVSFKTEPDMTIWEQEQPVEVLLTDEGGNRTLLSSRLIIRKDEEPPEMEGFYNLTIFEGDTIQYRKYLKVTDNCDENPKVTIDSSQVNRNEAGLYYATYRAEDMAGNVTEEEIFVRVMEKVPVTQEMVDELADAVLAEIITDGMTNRDKAYAIFKWTKRNIAYTGHTDPSDIVAGAYQGLKYRAGDCFTFCAVAHMLYIRAGFEAMKVDRTAGYLNHYWNYVNYGEGWYHCDSNLYRPDGFEAFMKTTEELVAYSTTVMERPDYYMYDESLYPPCGSTEEQTAAENASEGVEGQQEG